MYVGTGWSDGVGFDVQPPPRHVKVGVGMLGVGNGHQPAAGSGIRQAGFA